MAYIAFIPIFLVHVHGQQYMSISTNKYDSHDTDIILELQTSYKIIIIFIAIIINTANVQVAARVRIASYKEKEVVWSKEEDYA